MKETGRDKGRGKEKKGGRQRKGRREGRKIVQWNYEGNRAR